MERRKLVRKQFVNNKGVVAPLVAIFLVVFIGFMALAIDVGHLYVVRNELQNAADAAALAGTRALYVTSGSTIAVNTGANQAAYDQAIQNKSEKIAVDVHWQSGNTGDIQRGHWSFATHSFTASDSTEPPDITKSMTELDVDLNYVNAVQVTTRRQDTPAISFFAHIFGFQNFFLQATAVAYLGFAGTTEEADFPIAICRQAILDSSGNYDCHVGRLINSSSGGTGNTGAWTNFTQELPDGTGSCETASTPTVRNYVSGTATVPGITFGAQLGTIGGNVANLLNLLEQRWQAQPGGNTRPFSMKLPMIDCPDYPGQVGNCSTIVGIVELNMIWMNRTPTNMYQNAPRTMWHSTPTDADPDAGYQWNCTSGSTNEQCWRQFVDEFGLQKADGTPPYNSSDGYMNHTLYFLPSCKVISGGITGGMPSNVIATIPKLVR